MGELVILPKFRGRGGGGGSGACLYALLMGVNVGDGGWYQGGWWIWLLSWDSGVVAKVSMMGFVLGCGGGFRPEAEVREQTIAGCFKLKAEICI